MVHDDFIEKYVLTLVCWQCALPVVVPVQLKYVTGSIGWLFFIEHVQTDLKSNDGGIMLWAH